MSRITQLILGMATMVMSCSGDIVTSEIPLQGKLVGYVLSNRNQAVAEVNVTVEGSDPLLTTTTDSGGRFVFNELNGGTYNLIYSKDGYATARTQGFTFVGGSSETTISSNLYRTPKATVNAVSLLAVKSAIGTIFIQGFVDLALDESTLDETGSIRYYIDTKPEVSPTSYKETGVSNSYSLSQLKLVINSSIKSRFPSGTKAYVVLYPCAERVQSYVDLSSGTIIYSTIAASPSAVVNITIP